MDEVVEARAVLREQRQMEAGVAPPSCFAFASAARRDVGFISDNRIDAGRFAFTIKLDRSIEIAVIGQGQGIHSQIFGPSHQLRNSAGAVKQTVVAMTMQMNEGSVRHKTPWKHEIFR